MQNIVSQSSIRSEKEKSTFEQAKNLLVALSAVNQENLITNDLNSTDYTNQISDFLAWIAIKSSDNTSLDSKYDIRYLSALAAAGITLDMFLDVSKDKSVLSSLLIIAESKNYIKHEQSQFIMNIVNSNNKTTEAKNESNSEQTPELKNVLNMVLFGPNGEIKSPLEVKNSAEDFWNSFIYLLENNNYKQGEVISFDKTLQILGLSLEDFTGDYKNYLVAFAHPALLGEEVEDIERQVVRALAHRN